MVCPSAFIYHERYEDYFFGEWHPYKRDLWKRAMWWLERLGVFNIPGIKLVKAPPATREELELVHTREYIEFVKKMCDRGYGYLDYGDTPATKSLFDGATYRAGGSIEGARIITEGLVLHASNFGGGLHHAKPYAAAGFCVFNDVALAARYLQRNYNYKRIAIIDIDGHHGDGTQEIFYNDPGVLTVSLHRYGSFFYPGTGWYTEIGEGEGRGYSINIPLDCRVTDEAYLYAFKEVVLPVLNAYKPEIIITQFGADAHIGDPLVGLSLTTKTYREVARVLHEISHALCGGKFLVLGGGGYDPDATGRIWALAFVEISGVEMSEESITQLLDKEERSKGEIPGRIKELVKNIKEIIFPYHGLEVK